MAARHGRLRRKIFFGGLSAVLMLAGSAVVLVPVAGAVTTHDDYVLWGEKGVQVGKDSYVTGLVGARTNRTDKPSPHDSINMTGGARIVGDVRAGGKVKMVNKTEITGTLYRQSSAAGKLTAARTSTIGTDKPGTLASIDLPSGQIPRKWPLVYANAFCARNDLPNITEKAGKTITLTPGQYGVVKAAANTTLNFNGKGNYFLKELTVGTVKLNLTPGMNLFVCSKVSLGTIKNMPPASLKPSDVYVEVAAIPKHKDGHGFEVTNGRWVGDVVVPTAGIHYGSGGSGSAFMTGRFWAEHIDLEHSVQVRDGQRPTTTSTAPTTTTTVKPTTTTITTTTTTTVKPTTTTTTTTVPNPTTTTTFRT